MPTITLLAPISPVAWLPVAVFMFGIGNPPAVFLVFISVFFVMVLSTLAQIDAVPPSLPARGPHHGRDASGSCSAT